MMYFAAPILHDLMELEIFGDVKNHFLVI